MIFLWYLTVARTGYLTQKLTNGNLLFNFIVSERTMIGGKND
jgi:hypothetical protein